MLESHLANYRTRTYPQLVAMVGAGPNVSEASGPSGARYQIEVEVFWDSRVGGDVRVLGSIDDGGWRALHPVSDDFVMSSDGLFVGE